MTQSSMRIMVGSRNPVKINAVRNAFARVFDQCEIHCEGMHAPSLVDDQPMTDAETRLGAVNRVAYCREHSEADFYVAMEGGVDRFEDGAATYAYVVIANRERQSVGRSAQLPLPDSVFEALEAGEELGHVMDRLFNTENIKQKGGAIGLLTNGHESRESNYTQALILALAPFLHGERYPL